MGAGGVWVEMSWRWGVVVHGAAERVSGGGDRGAKNLVEHPAPGGLHACWLWYTSGRSALSRCRVLARPQSLALPPSPRLSLAAVRVRDPRPGAATDGAFLPTVSGQTVAVLRLSLSLARLMEFA